MKTNRKENIAALETYLLPATRSMEEARDMCQSRANAAGDHVFESMAKAFDATAKYLVNLHMMLHINECCEEMEDGS